MSSIFNENMTMQEAQLALYKAIDGKSKEEKEEITKEFEDISEKIVHNDSVINKNYLV